MVISALVFVFARPLMAIFADAGETEVILEGVRYLRIEGACDCGPLSSAFIERVNKGRKPPKRGMAGRETPIPKGSAPQRRSRIYRGFSHIAHKRRNVRFKGLRRVHTPPQPLTAHTPAHTPKHGGFSGSMVTMFSVVRSSTPSALFRQIRRSPLLLRKDTVMPFRLRASTLLRIR